MSHINVWNTFILLRNHRGSFSFCNNKLNVFIRFQLSVLQTVRMCQLLQSVRTLSRVKRRWSEREETIRTYGKSRWDVSTGQQVLRSSLMMFIWWGSAGNRMCNYTLIIELNSLLLFSGYENINVSILTSRAARRLFWWSLWPSVRWMLDQDWLQTLCDVTSHVRRPRLLKSDYQWAQRNFSDGRRRRRSRDQIRGKFKR